MEDVLVNRSSRNKLCTVLCRTLECIINNNNTREFSLFDTEVVDNYSFPMYMRGLFSFFDFEPSVLIYSFCLLDRIFETGFILSEKNIYKLFFISYAVSIKILQDNPYKDKDLAQVGGISIQEYQYLEAVFLEKLKYKIYVTEEQFAIYLKALSRF